jgi:hypothetical protein
MLELPTPTRIANALLALMDAGLVKAETKNGETYYSPFVVCGNWSAG